MDHLSLVKSPAIPPLSVPYLGTEAFDGQEFWTYPKRQGYDIKQLEKGRYRESPVLTRPFLQRWLFFGLLHEALGIHICLEDFVETDGSGPKFITTRKLPDYIASWEARLSCLGNELKRERLQALTDLMDDVHLFLCGLTTAAPHLLSDEMQLSLSILGQGLSYVEWSAWQSLGKKVEGRNWSFGKQFLEWKMSKEKWCPNEVARLKANLQATGMYFATLISRTRNGDVHNNCSTTKCKAYDIDNKEYRSMHVCKNPDDCELLEPAPAEVEAILLSKDGPGIPCIQVSTSQSTQALTSQDIHVIDASNNVKYTAISHVWSDGLGNVTQNALPRCQLERLRDLIIGMSDDKATQHESQPICLWIDTLCIPLRPQTRKLAISEISRIYTSARTVLVLDSELETASLASCTLEETMMRFTVSLWMRRLWTLEEAVCAQRLVVRFSDGYLNLNARLAQLLRPPAAENPSAMRRVLMAEMFYWAVHIDAIRSFRAGERTAAIWNAVHWRRASRSSDEAVIFASLLGLRTRSILDAPDEEKMKILWSLQQRVLQGILFVDVPRLKDPGYTWAPRAFGHEDIRDTTLGSRDEVGLMVDCTGYFLTVRALPLEKTFYLMTNEEYLTWARVSLYPQDSRYPTGLTADLALILEKPSLPSRGVLVSRQFHEHDNLDVAIVVKYECLMVLEPVSEDMSNSLRAMIESVTGYDHFVAGERKQKPMRWIIG